MASMKNAACGFGLLGTVRFDIPLICSIAIGDELEDVLRSIADKCRYRLGFEQKAYDYIFYDKGKEVFRFSYIGHYISCIRYAGISAQIPDEKIYRKDGKAYVSDAGIEGYMVWLKDLDTVKLKAVHGIGCREYSLSELKACAGNGSPSSITMAHRMMVESMHRKPEADINESERNSIAADLTGLDGEIAELTDKVYTLRNSIQRHKNRLGIIEKKYMDACKAHNEAVSFLNGTFGGYCGLRVITVQNLADMGKIRLGQHGAYVLAEGSQTETFYTEHDSVEVETRGYGLTDSERASGRCEVVERYDYQNGSGSDYTIVHHYKKRVKHEDEEYLTAKAWCSSAAYKREYRKVVDAYNTMVQAEAEYSKAKAEYENTCHSPEYIAACVELQKCVDMLNAALDKKKSIESGICVQ